MPTFRRARFHMDCIDPLLDQHRAAVALIQALLGT